MCQSAWHRLNALCDHNKPCVGTRSGSGQHSSLITVGVGMANLRRILVQEMGLMVPLAEDGP